MLSVWRRSRGKKKNMSYNLCSAKMTNRFVIEPSLKCNILCKFCYHLEKLNNKDYREKTFDQVKQEIDAGKQRGNNYFDITGGEPTIYPYITDIIEYGLSQELRSCVITNGIVSEDKTQNILNAGIDDWLVSRHGLEKTHNHITGFKHAYRDQIRFLNQIRKYMKFRFNVVINKFNQNELLEISKSISQYEPRIVNFINMNPHHEWMEKGQEIKEVIADLTEVEPILNESIEYLESKGIGVNVRYYPMCLIAEKYRRCICNDLHVLYDPYEWDYGVKKDDAFYRQWALLTSQSVELKTEPCSKCSIHNVCGGINKKFYEVSQVKLKPTKDNEMHGFWEYRGDNVSTLQEYFIY